MDDEPDDPDLDIVINLPCPACGYPKGVARLRPKDGGRSCSCPMCAHNWIVPPPLPS